MLHHEAGKPGNEPDHGDSPYEISGRKSHLCKACGDQYAYNPEHDQHRTDEKQLPTLDAQVEGQKRKRHIGLRKPDLLESPGKTKPVQQAESEGDDPWIGLGKAPLAGFYLNEFARDEGDAERDGCFHRFLRKTEIPERGSRQSDAVCQSKCGDCFGQQSPRSTRCRMRFA